MQHTGIQEIITPSTKQEAQRHSRNDNHEQKAVSTHAFKKSEPEHKAGTTQAFKKS